MIWFSDVRYRSLLTTLKYIDTPYVDYWISRLSYRLFVVTFDKRTNRVSTDVADKHARYISEIAT